MSQRILEKEVMLTEKEAVAYDRLVRQYFKIIHTGFILTVLNNSPEKGAFLDLGTGTGWIAIGVARHNPNCHVTAIDLSNTMLKVAKKNAVKEGVNDRITFLKGDVKSIPFGDGSFDSVFSHNMLHHIPNPMEMINEIARVAKKSGAVHIRDLIRWPKILAKLHVNIFGIFYNRLMKKEYYDSILASLSKKEWRHLLKRSNLKGARITSQFITHISIERPSAHKRDQKLIIAGPFGLGLFKNMYVSGS